jgi:hypothetical protein
VQEVLLVEFRCVAYCSVDVCAEVSVRFGKTFVLHPGCLVLSPAVQLEARLSDNAIGLSLFVGHIRSV